MALDLKLNNKVTFTGKLSNPEMYYAQADLYLIGSYYEGFPNALLEVGFHGVPAVAYDVPGGIPEIMTAQSGILVEDGNIERYRAAIRKAVAASWDRKAIASISKPGLTTRLNEQILQPIFAQVEYRFFRSQRCCSKQSHDHRCYELLPAHYEPDDGRPTQYVMVYWNQAGKCQWRNVHFVEVKSELWLWDILSFSTWCRR